jgi:aspartate carbamoyltransferase catalytic subunit
MKRDLIDIRDLSPAEIDRLIEKGRGYKLKNPAYIRLNARVKSWRSLFYEPSTRTRLIFEAAMYEPAGRTGFFRGTEQLGG